MTPNGSAKVPLSQLPPEEKTTRAASFGSVASHYERYRPGPPTAAVDWMLPTSARTVVDLGAGTGALTRLLVGRAEEVVAIEPDDRMRSVLTEAVVGARVLKGRGESLPLPDGSADAVLASSSWHWMDTLPTLNEVARVLRPGGMLGVVWSGPVPEGAFLAQAQAVVVQQVQAATDGGEDPGPLGMILGDVDRPTSTLEIPAGLPFDQPEHEVFQWDMALNADELIGLLGTMSWIITMTAEARDQATAEARRLLRDVLGVEGDVTVDVAFRADAWRSRRRG